MASSSYIKDKLESYFENANSVSRRIMEDISDSKKKVHNWNNWNENQQADFLWENLISKKTPNKYGEPRPSQNVKDIFSTLCVTPGEKIVIDEDTSNGRPFGCSWRDEHSAPFSWHTKSQLDLRLLDVEEDTTDTAANIKHTFPDTKSDIVNAVTDKMLLSTGAPARPKKGLKPTETPKRRPPPPPPPGPKMPQVMEKPTKQEPLVPKIPQITSPVEINMPTLVLADGALVMIQEPAKTPPEPPKPIIKQEKPPSIAKAKPKPPEPPKPTPKVQEQSEELDSPNKDIPKTGFDFLDNW